MNAAEAACWLSYARSDLNAAGTLLSHPEHSPRQVCFLAQQAAKKALKTEHPDLTGLTIWAVEARYPGDMPLVVEGDAQTALQTAEALVQSVAEDLQKHIGG